MPRNWIPNPSDGWEGEVRNICWCQRQPKIKWEYLGGKSLRIQAYSVQETYLRDYVTSFPFPRSGEYKVREKFRHRFSGPCDLWLLLLASFGVFFYQNYMLCCQICYMLEIEARRCYKERCLNSIYHPQRWVGTWLSVWRIYSNIWTFSIQIFILTFACIIFLVKNYLGNCLCPFFF